MFKTNTELIVIDAKATKPINTDVVFWSHDKGTAKLLFQLKKGIVSQTLAKGTIVPICLVFIGGRHIYHAVIEDAVNGIVSIVLEDNILGYQGRVDGSIYIELPDSRSLDTAGRFTFHIKRSPIDEDIPELEDYYWQGFNDIMEQYHESIAEIKLEAKTTLDSLTADVNTAQNKVSTLEQSIITANTNLNTRIDEISKKIDDNDVFTKAESSANVIYQIIGKENAEIKMTTDFAEKVAGSNIENANNLKTGAKAYIMKPSQFSQNATQTNYDKIKFLDGANFALSVASNGLYAQQLFDYDLIDLVTRNFSENFWTSRNIDTIDQKVSLIKSFFKQLSGRFFTLGLSAAGNKASIQIFNNATDELENTVSHAESTTTELVLNVDSADYISNAGHVYFVAYADPSDGTKTSSVLTDYSDLEITLDMSANECITSMIAQNHVTNLATIDEAKAGTNTTKTMTPATTAQAIDNRAVTLASNQTIGGIKNFKDGLMVGGDLAVSKNDHSVFILSASNCDKIIDGAATFIKHGALVITLGTFKFKTAVAFGTVISSALPAELSATIVNGIVAGTGSNDTAKAMYSEKGTTNLKANSNFAINEWFTFGGVYWTGKDK